MAKFNTRKAAEDILAIMRQLGLKTSRGNDNHTWINHNKDESRICIGGNFIMVSVTEAGVAMRSSHAMFYGWSERTSSYREFKKNMMGHILFYYGKD